MALVELSAVELRRQIGEKKVSPVELMQACIDHIETYNPAVNAICATDYERALASARAAEAQVIRGDTLPALHSSTKSGSEVCSPRIPTVERENSTSLLSRSCGAWSLAIASTVPSAIPAKSPSIFSA